MELVLLSFLLITGVIGLPIWIMTLANDNQRLRRQLQRRDDPATTLRAIHEIGDATRGEVRRAAAEFEAIVKQAAQSGREEKRR